MKRINFILIVLITCFSACINEQENNTDDKIFTADTSSSIILIDQTTGSYYEDFYSRSDSSNYMVRFRKKNGKLFLTLDLNDSLAFSNFLIDFDSLINIASDKFEFDSLKRITIDLLSTQNNTTDIEYELTNHNKTQDYLNSFKTGNTKFLDHKLLADILPETKILKSLIEKLSFYSLEIDTIFLEKCRCNKNDHINCITILIGIRTKHN